MSIFLCHYLMQKYIKKKYRPKIIAENIYKIVFFMMMVNN